MGSRSLKVEQVRNNSWLVGVYQKADDHTYRIGHLEKLEIGWAWTLNDDTSDYPPTGRFDGSSLDDAVLALLKRARQELLDEVEMAQERLGDYDTMLAEIQYRVQSEPWKYPKPNPE